MINKKPEEKARAIIDRQLRAAGWDVVSREEYVPNSSSAVKEALMQGKLESDYLLFVDNKAIAVLEAKKKEDSLGAKVASQAENYAKSPESWYGLWVNNMVPLVYMANGDKILFKNMLEPDSDYEEIKEMHSPKRMLKIINEKSDFGALPVIDKEGLRDCQYRAEINFEESIKNGDKKALAVLATGSGKTYLACLASYRLLNYTSVGRVLFLVDRNNLGKQALAEYSSFDRTENREEMSSLYAINRLRKESDVNGEVVISTIQKLYSVLTGQALTDSNEDEEDEINAAEEEKSVKEVVTLGDNLKLAPDHFQFIVVDECHRSIYGKWKAVLDYFSGAYVLGLTATPTPEAYAFFNNNVVENYTYDTSVIEGVNVPYRIYRISTEITEHGGVLEDGSEVIEITKRTGEEESFRVAEAVYSYAELDRAVVNTDQIKTVLRAYKDAIYEELYPEREKNWEYIPKTLIYAKDENHATEIVKCVKEVFKCEFEDERLPENFVKKITYTAEDSDELIRQMRTEKDFRIAVTVTLVATGTDIKPLEVVMFMKDVLSESLYTQMKGRGCRTISEDMLREVTPNAEYKECFYIVDAVGVTEHIHVIPPPRFKVGKYGKILLKDLLERLAHGELSDDNLFLLRDYCASINRRYEHNDLFGRHLDYFITTYGFAPREIANNIQEAFEQGVLELHSYFSPSDSNVVRSNLVEDLILNADARRKLLEMQKGYTIRTDGDPDTLIYAGFSKETALDYITNFEKYLEDNKDSIEALRIIYNAEDTLITYSMLSDLRDRLLAENRQYGIYQLWKNYKILDTEGNVDELDLKANVGALTHLIQIVRFAYGKNQKLTSLFNGYASRLSLYCGQEQRSLTEDQLDVMRQIAEYIINDGAITAKELNSIDTDLWRKGITSIGLNTLEEEMEILARFILKVA